jgi:chromosomal replication initiation ATPase DnaA
VPRKPKPTLPPPPPKSQAPRASVRQARKDRVAAHAARYSLTQEQIETMCADILTAHGATWLTVTGRSTSGALIRPRLEIYRRLLALGWSYSAIGRACNRDHTTIIYYVEKWGKTDE